VRKLKWLLPLALFVPLLMAPTGGYPVNPFFFNATSQTLKVTGQASAINQCGNLAATNLCTNLGNGGWSLAVGNTGISPLGEIIQLGASAVDIPFKIENAAGTSALFQVNGVGDTVINSSSGATLVLNTNTGGNALQIGDGTLSVLEGFGASQFVLDVQTNHVMVLQTANSTRLTIGNNTTGGGLQVGSPTGADKGAGTLNATGLFVNGAALLPVVSVASTSVGTSRTSTVTLTCDATLVVTAPTQSKLYSLRITASYDQQGASTNGIQVNVGVTGTGTVISGTAMIGSNNGAAAAGQGPTSLTPGNVQNALSFTGSATQTDSILIDALVSTGAGAATFCLNWAQATSSVSSTRMDTGYVTLTQLN
jgi:hypothetical protein